MANNRRPKDRCTAAQFDQALLEQIQHVRGMNMPVNAISSAATFCILVHNRLFGERTEKDRSDAFNKVFRQLIEDAKVERARYQMQQEQLAKQQREQAERYIIVPGDPRFRN